LPDAYCFPDAVGTIFDLPPEIIILLISMAAGISPLIRMITATEKELS